MNGKDITDKDSIANTFNTYFCNVGSNLAACLNTNQSSSENYQHFLAKPLVNTFFCDAITAQEITASVSLIKPKK